MPVSTLPPTPSPLQNLNFRARTNARAGGAVFRAVLKCIRARFSNGLRVFVYRRLSESEQGLDRTVARL
jgi:hypothetical protein